MTTIAQYVETGLRLCGILGESDSVSPEQGADGLVVLNDLMGSLRGDGIELGYNPQTSTTATMLLPEEDRLGIKYLLSVHLCLNYGRNPSQLVASLADGHYKRMLRRAVNNDALPNNAITPRGEGQLYRSRILTDS